MSAHLVSVLRLRDPASAILSRLYSYVGNGRARLCHEDLGKACAAWPEEHSKLQQRVYARTFSRRPRACLIKTHSIHAGSLHSHAKRHLACFWQQIVDCRDPGQKRFTKLRS